MSGSFKRKAETQENRMHAMTKHVIRFNSSRVHLRTSYLILVHPPPSPKSSSPPCLFVISRTSRAKSHVPATSSYLQPLQLLSTAFQFTHKLRTHLSNDHAYQLEHVCSSCPTFALFLDSFSTSTSSNCTLIANSSHSLSSHSQAVWLLSSFQAWLIPPHS